LQYFCLLAEEYAHVEKPESIALLTVSFSRLSASQGRLSLSSIQKNRLSCSFGKFFLSKDGKVALFVCLSHSTVHSSLFFF